MSRLLIVLFAFSLGLSAAKADDWKFASGPGGCTASVFAPDGLVMLKTLADGSLFLQLVKLDWKPKGGKIDLYFNGFRKYTIDAVVIGFASNPGTSGLSAVVDRDVVRLIRDSGSFWIGFDTHESTWNVGLSGSSRTIRAFTACAKELSQWSGK
jgi:hypothetical protein